MKLAIVLPHWVGDVVMATPSLRALRVRFPQSEIVGIARPNVVDVLAGTGLIDRTLLYDARSNEPSLGGWHLLRSLWRERFDAALMLTNSQRTGWLVWLSGTKRRVGFAHDFRGWWLTDRVAMRSRMHSMMDEYLRLTEVLGCSREVHPIELAVLPEDQETLDSFWNSQEHRRDRTGIRVPRPTSYVCMNSGGAFGPAKNWPRASFAKLARRIAIQLGRTVLITCGPAEREDARWIASTANHADVVSLAGAKLSIGLTKAAIRQSSVLVTTDSGPRHFAAAFGTPVITIFGPTLIEWSETRYEKAEHLQLELDCIPCQQRECPLGHHRCMQDLTVDAVFSAVQRRLSSHSIRLRAA